MESNPYTGPSSPGIGGGYSAGVTSEAVILQLVRTKPWVRLFSVLTFLGSALMCLGGVGMLIAGFFASNATGRSDAVNPGISMMAGFSVFYFVIAGLYIYPGIKLWKYASRIAVLMTSRSDFDLERALNEQRSFWKFAGISVIVVVGLYIVGVILFAVGIGFASSRVMSN